MIMRNLIPILIVVAIVGILIALAPAFVRADNSQVDPWHYQTIGVEVYEKPGEERAPVLWLAFRGGPGTVSSVGGSVLTRLTRGLRAGVALDYWSGESTPESLRVGCKSSPSSIWGTGHRHSSRTICEARADAAVDGGGSILVQALAEYHLERGWRVDPYLGAGIGAVIEDDDDALAGSISLGFTVPLWRELRFDGAYRWIGVQEAPDSIHQGQLGLRYGF